MKILLVAKEEHEKILAVFRIILLTVYTRSNDLIKNSTNTKKYQSNIPR